MFTYLKKIQFFFSLTCGNLMLLLWCMRVIFIIFFSVFIQNIHTRKKNSSKIDSFLCASYAMYALLFCLIDLIWSGIIKYSISFFFFFFIQNFNNCIVENILKKEFFNHFFLLSLLTLFHSLNGQWLSLKVNNTKRGRRVRSI